MEDKMTAQVSVLSHLTHSILNEPNVKVCNNFTNLNLISTTNVLNNYQTKAALLGKIDKQHIIDTQTLDDVLLSIQRCIKGEDHELTHVAVKRVAKLLSQFSNQEKFCTAKQLSCDIAEKVELFTAAIKQTLEQDYSSSEHKYIRYLLNFCRVCVNFFDQCIIDSQQINDPPLQLHKLHDFVNSILHSIQIIFSRSSEWKVVLINKKYPSAEMEGIRKEQAELFSESVSLLNKFLAMVTLLDPLSIESDCDELLFICNQLLPICEISASWHDLMDSSWKAIHTITTKYSESLRGKIDVDRILKSLVFIIQYKFKECVALAPRYKLDPVTANKQILPPSDQNAFLNSIKFVRFALVALVTVCKSYASSIQSGVEGLVELALTIRSEFPPSPSSHTLGPSAVEAFGAISPAIDGLFKVIIGNAETDDHYKWKVFQCFEIPSLDDIVMGSTHHHLSVTGAATVFPGLFALEKLQFLNTMISHTSNLSLELFVKMNECVEWIMNGVIMCSADMLYSSNQISRAHKVPLYIKTYMALASFLSHLAQRSLLTHAFSWLIKYSFHPHYFCNLLAFDLWQFIGKHTRDFDSLTNILKMLITHFKDNKRIESRNQLETLCKKLFVVIPENYRVQLFRDLLPSPIQMSALDTYLFYLSVLPFDLTGRAVQHIISSKIIPLCIQRCQQQVSPVFINPQHIPMLLEVFTCCYNVFKHEKVVSCIKDHRVRLIELVLQLLPFPQVYYHSALCSTLIRLAASLRHDFDIQQLLDFVDLLLQIAQLNSGAKSAIVDFYKLSADIEMAEKSALQPQIFAKFRQINSILLDDTDWMVRIAAFQAVEQYSKFSIFDFRATIPPEKLTEVLSFLQNQTKSVVIPTEYEQLKHQQMIVNQAIVGRKRGLPAQAVPPFKRQKVVEEPKSVDDRLKRGFELIKEGFSIIEPVQCVLSSSQVTTAKNEIIQIQAMLDKFENDITNPIEL